MKAMILAAGFGTRLKPLTDHIPKALIEINGTPMLELLILKMIRFGITEIIINVHHYAQQIVDFLKMKKYFGIRIELSIENEILGTGGGIKKAAYFFGDDLPFLVHNVDIISNIDISKLLQVQQQKKHLATLAVMTRHTDRYFIVDDQDLIFGHINASKDLKRIVRKPVGAARNVAFSGIHIISPAIFPHLSQQGFFSIVDAYLELVAAGYAIGAYHMDHCYWRDLGRIENVLEVERDIENNILAL